MLGKETFVYSHTIKEKRGKKKKKSGIDCEWLWKVRVSYGLENDRAGRVMGSVCKYNRFS